jgi:hypothetical protein
VNEDTSGSIVHGGLEGQYPFGLAADAGGNFMVVWDHIPGSDGGPASINARVFDGSGAPLTGEFVVNATTMSGGYLPTVAADGAGHFVVVWDHGAIAGRRFDLSGTPAGGEFSVSSSPMDYTLRVAANGAGHFVVVWDEDFYVYGREFDGNAAPVADRFRIDESPTTVGYPRIAANTAGDFVVVWSQYDYDNYEGGSADNIWGRRLAEKPVSCTPAPKAGCRALTTPPRGVFRYTKGSTDARNVLAWRWPAGDAVSLQDLGDPFATTSYAFCVYDAGGGAQPLLHAELPPGQACGAIACWRQTSAARVDYQDNARYVLGINLLRLKTGASRASVMVRAGGPRLALPTAALTPPVTVQLQAANGTCWSADYAARVTRNLPSQFRASPGP